MQNLQTKFQIVQNIEFAEDGTSHRNKLLEQIGSLFDGSYSDATLKVGNSYFKVHKCILAVRSPYFSALFYNGMKESFLKPNEEIEVHDIDTSTFRDLLIYAYTGSINHIIEKDLCPTNMLIAADQFGFIHLFEAMSKIVEKKVDRFNALQIYEVAFLKQIEKLTKKCLMEIDAYSEEILASKMFLKSSEEVVRSILIRSTFYASEAIIVKFLIDWHNMRGILLNPTHKLLECARLNLLKL
ncbi:hypothetical protein ACOME3_004430 [Neoechinorhynchus agilis]